MAMMPIQARVPTIVAMAAAAKAMVKVFHMASIIMLLPSISLYHFSENPVQMDIDLLLLKENTINVRMGRYRNNMMRMR